MNVKVLSRFTWRGDEYLIQGDFDANGDWIATMMTACKGVDLFAIAGKDVLTEYDGDLEAANYNGSYFFITHA